MDWVTKRLMEIEEILEQELQKIRSLLARREEMLHDRRAIHNWENEGGKSE